MRRSMHPLRLPVRAYANGLRVNVNIHGGRLRARLSREMNFE